MLAYLRLFRWQNLLVVALSQYLFRYCIVVHALKSQNIQPFFTDFEFFLLVLATVLVSAAGYAINDYFDLRVDRINKAHKIILGKDLSRRKAIFVHTVLNIIAVIIGLYLTYRVRYIPLAGVFVVVPALLWIYSIKYKRKFLIGNIIVALLSAIVIAIVWIFEYRGIMISYDVNIQTVRINQLLGFYLLFAFFSSFIREIIKDIEDIKGDMKTGCRTIPIVAGVRSSKRLIIILIIILIFFVGYFQIFLLGLEYDLIFAYLLFAVQIPLILFINRINLAKEKIDYTINSRYAKFVMVAGVISMFLFCFYL